jgi:hypothetical protein
MDLIRITSYSNIVPVGKVSIFFKNISILLDTYVSHSVSKSALNNSYGISFYSYIVASLFS